MDITRRCDYACRMLRAAYRSGEVHLPVAEVAEQEDIPYAFARSIQHDLTKRGFVSTARGAHGGLKLGCDPASVTVRDVVEAVQGPVCVSECGGGFAPCGKSETCAYNKVWLGADRILSDYLGSITLRDLFELGAAHPSVRAALGSDASTAPVCGGCGDKHMAHDVAASRPAAATAPENTAPNPVAAGKRTGA